LRWISICPAGILMPGGESPPKVDMLNILRTEDRTGPTVPKHAFRRGCSIASAEGGRIASLLKWK
jgi:hypothetical protein